MRLRRVVQRLKNHFELFGLEPVFAVDTAALERGYREIQSQIHPDRFAASGEAERRASMQWTTRVNEAYRTLRSPVQRAKYLLALGGVDVAFETNTQMPTDFLMQQLEWREALAEAKDAAALDRLREGVEREKAALEVRIGELIDARRELQAAAGEVRKLMFLQRLGEEIELAYEDGG